ncbi:hypothetical protein TIFTF001_019665 [Ficus carica]|uniref:Uncharacterized protein n=1 Tax=Ficus carica TaxID=3494 RepID=A0AA88AT69_FICCA|nr:hypothetical protein TIFTF001_019665 [Ficus carica]
MEIRKWCSSSHNRRSIRLGQDYNSDEFSWRVFWSKFKREKIMMRMRKIFFHSSAVNPRRLVPYDPCSYSQNFDRGFAWDDHHDHEFDGEDNLSRSFSFRFADPSKILAQLDKENLG